MRKTLHNIRDHNIDGVHLGWVVVGFLGSEFLFLKSDGWTDFRFEEMKDLADLNEPEDGYFRFRQSYQE